MTFSLRGSSVRLICIVRIITKYELNSLCIVSCVKGTRELIVYEMSYIFDLNCVG